MVYAQTSRSKVTFSADFGLPLGENTERLTPFIWGGAIKYDKRVINNLFFSVSAGYTRVVLTDNILDYHTLPYIPIKAGGKYFIDKSIFAEGYLGTALRTIEGPKNEFLYSVGIGAEVSKGLELGVRYESWSGNYKIKQLAFRLGFSF